MAVRGNLNSRFEILDAVLLAILVCFGLIIIFPFVNVIAISFASEKEYLSSKFLLIPKRPIFDNYIWLLADNRLWIGYRTTFIFLAVGVPINLFLTSSVAYGLSRQAFPGKKIIFFGILFTMLFNGGIVPLYMVMRELRLVNTIWSVVFATGINSFYMIIMRSYFMSLPEALMESAKLDGAGEWRILIQIILPLSMPIMATIILFCCVDRWNEWYNAMIFIRKNTLVPLQLVLRSMVAESTAVATAVFSGASDRSDYAEGIKAACVIIVMLPVMCVFPFLQRYFVKGIMIGAIKS